MKKTIGIVAIAMAVSIAFSGVALASQPVCPTPETESIRTVTMISCQGMMSEYESVTWESSNEDLLNNPPLIDFEIDDEYSGEEVVGKLVYKQDLKVTDGMTKFVKDMGVDTGESPNLNVMNSMGYLQGPTIGSLSHDEEVSMGIVADWAGTSGVILCPFAAAEISQLPASCEDVTALSSMVVTDVLATTRTKVEMSEAPVSLHYAITATGHAGAGTNAQGSIAAEFSVYVEDGSAGSVDEECEPGEEGFEHCELGSPDMYTVGSKLTYLEKSTANGLWEFSKEMDYTSVIRP